MKRIICFIFLLIMPMVIHIPSIKAMESLKTLEKAIDPNYPIKTVISELSTITHELGHAAAHYFLTGPHKYIYVQIGSHTTPTTIPNGFSFKIKKWGSNNGITISKSIFAKKSTPIKNIFITLAGPLAGIACALTTYKVLNYLNIFTQEERDILAGVSIVNDVYNLLSIEKGTDGSKILKQLKKLITIHK